MRQLRPVLFGLALAASAVAGLPLGVHAAGGAHSQPAAEADSLTPAQRMARRFPQPVKVGDLVGWPLLDYDDRVLGHVTEVARLADGAMVLVVPVGGWFGLGGRPVAVPVETVALIGRHVALLDLTPEELAALPTWTGAGATPVAAQTTIRLAISRR